MEYPNFNWQYFLVGTHYNEETEKHGADTVNILKFRLPKYSHESKNTIDYTKLEDDHSAPEVVECYAHDGEVNKARAMH
jgi:hypothetical protein